RYGGVEVGPYGGVEVGPTTGNRIVVDVKKTVRATDQNDADRIAKEMTFSIKTESPGYRIVSNVQNYQSFPDGRRIRTSLTIRVPKRSSLRIDNRNGAVNVTDLVGNQVIANKFGDVSIRDIGGSVDIDNQNGNISVSGITNWAHVPQNVAGKT